MARGVSKIRRSLRAGRFGRRSEEFVAKDHVEVEWRLEATDLDFAESWLKKRSPTSNLAAIPDTMKALLDAYYGTENWRSYRAGNSQRARGEGESAGATMKVLTSAESALRQRREIFEPLKSNAKSPKVTRRPVVESVRRLAKFDLGLSAAGLNPSGASNVDLKQRSEPSNEKPGG